MDLGQVSAWALGAGVVGLLVLHEINTHLDRTHQEDPVPTPAPDATVDPAATRAALRETPLRDRAALRAVRAEDRSAAAALLDAVDALHAPTGRRAAPTSPDTTPTPLPAVWVRSLDPTAPLVHALDADSDQLAELVEHGQVVPGAGAALLYRCGDITTVAVSANEVGFTRCEGCLTATGTDPGGAP